LFTILCSQSTHYFTDMPKTKPEKRSHEDAFGAGDGQSQEAADVRKHMLSLFIRIYHHADYCP